MGFNAFDAGCLCSDKVALARMKTLPPILGLTYYPFAFLNVSYCGALSKDEGLSKMKYRPTKKIKYLLLKAGQLKIIYSSKQDIFYFFSAKEGETAFFSPGWHKAL